MFNKLITVLKDTIVSSFSASLKKSNLNKYQLDKAERNKIWSLLKSLIVLTLFILLSQLFYLISDIVTGNFSNEMLFDAYYIFNLIAEVGLLIDSFLFIMIASNMVYKKNNNLTNQKVLIVIHYIFVTLCLCLYVISKILRKGGIVNIDSSVVYMCIILMICPAYKNRINFIFISFMILSLLITGLVVNSNMENVVYDVAQAQSNGFPNMMWFLYNAVFLVFGAIVAAYSNGLNVKKQIQEIKLTEMNETLNQELEMDELTQVYNRRSMKIYLDSKENEWKETSASVAMFMLDIDFFKLYNDKYGHLKGDDCLRRVAQATKQAVSNYSGRVYRYGGEEFVIVVENVDQGKGLKIATDIHKEIANLRIVHEGVDESRETMLSVSLGMTIETSFKRQPSQWILDADQQLYRAKHEGRNCTSYQNNIYR